MVFLLQNMRNRYSLTDDCSMLASTLSKAIGCCRGVCNARVRFVTRQGYSFSIIAGSDLAHFTGTDKFCIDTLLFLHVHIGPQGFCPLLIRQDKHARRYKATIATHQVGEMLEGGKAILCHAHGEIIRVVLPDDSPRTPRCTIAKCLPFQYYNASTSLFSKMVGNARTHHTTTNDEDISCFGHDHGLLKMKFPSVFRLTADDGDCKLFWMHWSPGE